jgi:hypothetical protein
MTTLRQPRGKRLQVSVFSIISHAVVALMSFHVGLLFGSGGNPQVPCKEASSGPPPQLVVSAGKEIFPKATIGQLIAGASLVDRKDFTTSFDIGVPWDIPKKEGNSQVLMLYSHNSSLPSAWNPSSGLPVYSSAEEAAKNCDVLKVVLVQPDKENECVAVMGQWESYHVHKFMRLPTEVKGKTKKLKEGEGGVSRELDLRYVSRQHLTNGRVPGLPPANALTTGKYGEVLKDYLEKLPGTLKRLTPIAAKVARGGNGKGNTIIVMVCNFGQSELLFNFVCSARARGLDLSRILLFATDEDIIGLASQLGIAVFDVKDAFGEMPKEAARGYGDKVFAGKLLYLR